MENIILCAVNNLIYRYIAYIYIYMYVCIYILYVLYVYIIYLYIHIYIYIIYLYIYIHIMKYEWLKNESNYFVTCKYFRLILQPLQTVTNVN